MKFFFSGSEVSSRDEVLRPAENVGKRRGLVRTAKRTLAGVVLVTATASVVPADAVAGRTQVLFEREVGRCTWDDFLDIKSGEAERQRIMRLVESHEGLPPLIERTCEELVAYLPEARPRLRLLPGETSDGDLLAIEAVAPLPAAPVYAAFDRFLEEWWDDVDEPEAAELVPSVAFT